MKKRLYSILGLGLVAALSPAFATDLANGASGPANALTVSNTSTLVASTSGSFSSGTFNANYWEYVYSDPNNTFCAGCLDWVVQIQDTGAVGSYSGIIEHVTVADFTGFQTNAGVNMTGAPGLAASGTDSPSDVVRSGDGSVITWDFTGTGGGNNIQPGQTTELLELMTDAQSIVPGTLGAIDGKGIGADAYGPATPEPMSLGLIGGGLALLGVIYRRRAASQA